ncbi:thermonuclease family protein [Methylobacterium oryzisoli]|uniref:thermonuclease family protein n=1 Tax=Methylobacterium oryzisoli TaxID=3385502 RepID=UPI0038928551
MTSRETVQASIRAEIDRQRPVEVARRTLELLAASAVRAIDAPPGYQVVGRDGTPRTRQQDGATVPFTLADLIGELRHQHPRLFLPPEAAAPPREPFPARESPALQESLALQESPALHEAPASQAPREAAPAPVASISESPAAVPEPAISDRDWITLGPAAATAGAQVPPSRRPAWRDAAVAIVSRLGRPIKARPRPATPAAAPPAAVAPPSGPVPPPAAPAAPAAEGLRPAVARPVRQGGRRRPVYAALAGLLVVGAGYWSLAGGDQSATNRAVTVIEPKSGRPSSEEAKSGAPAPRGEVGETGTLVPATPAAPQPPAASLAGVAEVIDTATLKLGGRTVRLFGVEWSKGAQGADLANYLAGRPVACQPAAKGTGYTCTVDGHDLSEVVLYNGGGRATPEATTDLVEAERHARTEKLGIWRK